MLSQAVAEQIKIDRSAANGSQRAANEIISTAQMGIESENNFNQQNQQRQMASADDQPQPSTSKAPAVDDNLRAREVGDNIILDAEKFRATINDLQDPSGAYEQVWILGDHFVRESKKLIRRLFRVKDTTPAVGEETYISTKYEVDIFSNSANASHVRSVLGRVRNLLVEALDKYDKLPKYIILVLENDLLRCIKFEGVGLSEMYRRIIKWLAQEFRNIISKRKHDLPPKAKKFNYPQIFWVALPYHSNFGIHAINRHKFNQGIEAVADIFAEMRFIKIRCVWSDVDSSVTPAGVITEMGRNKYWRGLDEAVKFWGNGRKRPGNNNQDGNRFSTLAIAKHQKFSDSYSSKYKWFPRNKDYQSRK